jgi:Carboxypeptidase regulatory-like domain
MRRKTTRLVCGALLGGVLFLTWADWAGAYETMPVTNGGAVQGKVMFKGTPPPPKVFELWRFPDKTFCGGISEKGRRLLREVIVGQDGGLNDVVVVIEGIQKGKPFTFISAQMDANVCQFTPFVSVVSDKRQLTVTNRDPVAHDLQGYAYDLSGVDIVLHRPSLNNQGTTDVVNLTKGRKIFTMQCGRHPYMQSWGYAIDNPYYAVTGVDGTFTIGQLPQGKYKVKAWHPILGSQERDITVTANGTATLDFTFEYR